MTDKADELIDPYRKNAIMRLLSEAYWHESEAATMVSMDHRFGNFMPHTETDYEALVSRARFLRAKAQRIRADATKRK